MSKSLRQILIEEIEDKGFVGIERIEEITKSLGHKMSNAERRLRKSESPNIEAVRNKKGFIIGYQAIQFYDEHHEPVLFKLEPISRLPNLTITYKD